MYRPINRSSEEIIKDAREFLNYKNRISQEMMEKVHMDQTFYCYIIVFQIP